MAVRQPPTRAHRGESARAAVPTSWSASLPPPSSPGGFDSDEPRWISQTVPTT